MLLNRDISFLYDAKVIDNRSKPLTSLAKSREVKNDSNVMGDVGMKTPGIEVGFLLNSQQDLKNLTFPRFNSSIELLFNLAIF